MTPSTPAMETAMRRVGAQSQVSWGGRAREIEPLKPRPRVARARSTLVAVAECFARAMRPLGAANGAHAAASTRADSALRLLSAPAARRARAGLCREEVHAQGSGRLRVGLVTVGPAPSRCHRPSETFASASGLPLRWPERPMLPRSKPRSRSRSGLALYFSPTPIPRASVRRRKSSCGRQMARRTRMGSCASTSRP